MTVNTTEDGWGCVPQLRKAVLSIKKCDDLVYEITHCVRHRDLRSIVRELDVSLREALITLNEIDTDLSYKTIVDEE